MLATLMHTHPGTVYIYQGEEIGMTNVNFPSIEYYNEKYTVGKYETMVESGIEPMQALNSLKMMSRDNVRTPMQWNNKVHGGFTTGTPWMHVNPNYKEINVEKEEQTQHSVLNYYKILTSLRKKNPIMVYGSYHQLYESDPELIVYERTYEEVTWLVICNFYGNEHKMPDKLEKRLRENSKIRLLLSNYYSNDKSTIKPYEACIYEIK